VSGQGLEDLDLSRAADQPRIIDLEEQA